jgi:hypothetical protein
VDGIRVMGLWKRRSKTTGREFLAGKIGLAQILVFENDRKRNESDADFMVYVANVDPAEQGRAADRGPGKPRPTRRTAADRRSAPR